MEPKHSEKPNQENQDNSDISYHFQNVFSALEETMKAKKGNNGNFDELSQLFNNLFPLVTTFKEQNLRLIEGKLEKISLKYNKDLLFNLFYLIGEDNEIQANNLIQLLRIMLDKSEHFSSPFSWENLISIIEEEIMTGNNDSEIFKSLSKIFHFLPLSAVKRLFGDFLDYMKTLLESYLEDTKSLLPSLFNNILTFLISTKLNTSFQKKFINNEIHFILYRILKAMYQLEGLDEAVCFIPENRKLLIQIIVNCLSVADEKVCVKFAEELLFHPISINMQKFEKEVLTPLLYTTSVSDIVPVFVDFKYGDISFENKLSELTQNNPCSNQSVFIHDELFKKCLNMDYPWTNHNWKCINGSLLTLEDVKNSDFVFFEFSLELEDSVIPLIALTTSGFSQMESGIKTNGSKGNFLFKLENKFEMLADEISLSFWIDDWGISCGPKPFKIEIFSPDFNPISLKKHVLSIEKEVLNSPKLDGEVLNLRDGAILNFPCSTKIWSTFKVINANEFEKDLLQQFHSFFPHNDKPLFLLPSKLTLEEFILILYNNNIEKIASLRLTLNQEKVGMHGKLGDLLIKEKINFLELTIKSVDDSIEQKPLLPPEEVLEIALTKISYQPWNLVSACSSLFSQQALFLTLFQITSNVPNKTDDLSLRYQILSEEFSAHLRLVELLFGNKVYGLFFWFLFNEGSIESDLKILWQTISYDILNSDLSSFKPNDLLLLFDSVLSTFVNKKDLESEYQKLRDNLSSMYKIGLIKDKKKIQLLVEGILWQGQVLKDNNEKLQILLLLESCDCFKSENSCEVKKFI